MGEYLPWIIIVGIVIIIYNLGVFSKAILEKLDEILKRLPEREEIDDSSFDD